VCAWKATSSTSTTTTQPTGWTYPYGITRKGGATYTASEKMPAVLPTPAATDMDPVSLKCYVDIDSAVAIFDGAGRNRIDDGYNLFDFNALAPQNAGSVSTSTSTSTTTTSSTTTTTTLTTSTTTTV